MVRIFATLALLSLSAFAQSAAKPNFSGIWKLNVEKSDFGPMPGPDSRVDTIEHKDPDLRVHTVADSSAQGKQDYELKFTTDGKEVTNNPGGREIKSTAAWEGDTLVVNSKLNFNDNEIVIKAVYTLTDGGKVMNVAAHITSPMGELDQKMVYDKQTADAAATKEPETKKEPEPSK